MKKCAAMNSGFWQPKDIKEHPCSSCGAAIEFWKDDVKVKCDKCGSENFNPSLSNLCLSWCKSAAKCLGNSTIDEWKKQLDSGVIKGLGAGNSTKPKL
jgi:hypothetical protein